MSFNKPDRDISGSKPFVPSEGIQDAPRQVTVRVAMPGGRPWVTYLLLGLTIGVYVLQLSSKFFLQGVDYPAMMGMKINEAIVAGQFWRLLTPVLLHGSPLHIGFNMYALYIFGRVLERYYGHARFLMLYLVAGFAGNAISYLLSTAPSLGASTSIFGLVAAEGIFIYRNRFLFGQNARRQLTNIVTIVGINLVLGLSPGIDNWGHLGGLLGGLAFAWFAGPLFQVRGIKPDLTVADQRDTSKAIQVVVIEGLVLVVIIALGIMLS